MSGRLKGWWWRVRGSVIRLNTIWFWRTDRGSPHIELFNPTGEVAEAEDMSFLDKQSEEENVSIFEELAMERKSWKGDSFKKRQLKCFQSPKAYVNVKLRKAKANTVITLSFKHLNSKSKLTPISTRIEKSGNTTLCIVLNPLKKGGLPVTTACVRASTEDGDSIAMSFKVYAKHPDEDEGDVNSTDTGAVDGARR